MTHLDPAKRHDFVILFDVADGNPNGDPDGGNMPRTDPDTLQGLVTDVALKRKVRNFVALAARDLPEAVRHRYGIFIEHRGVLNDQIRRAYVEQGIPVGKRVKKPVDATLLPYLRAVASNLPSALVFEDSDDEAGDSEPATLSYSGELSSDEFKAALDELGEELDKGLRKFMNDLAKEAGKPDKNRVNAEKAQRWMCEHFYDVRMFGAVMSTGLNAGQVRGPMQLTFARSVDSVLARDLAVTRVAVTDPKDREKLQTIGRKTLVHYGLYAGQGFYSPHLANLGEGYAVTREDLELFWQALEHMWALDRSAARGMMACRRLYVFSHASKLGNAHAHQLFDLVKVSPVGGTPRRFEDYAGRIEDLKLDRPGATLDLSAHEFPGVTLTRLV